MNYNSYSECSHNSSHSNNNYKVGKRGKKEYQG